VLFPAIRDAFKDLVQGFGSDSISLGLKDANPADSNPNDWYARNGYREIAALAGAGVASWAGESVTISTALNHSVVWACNRIISEPVGFLPLNLYQRKNKEKQLATAHPMFSAFHDQPNPEMTAARFRETGTSQCVLGGNAYAKIERRSGTGTAMELYLLDPCQVRIDREKTGAKRLVYVVKDGSTETSYTVKPDKPHDILHVPGISGNGICGYSVISMARQSLGTAIATEHNVGNFYRNGGRVPYILQMAQKFKSDADFDRFRANWEKVYSQSHRAPILENGTTYKQIGLSHSDAQLLETRQFSIPEICRWFSVSPHMVGDLSQATFSNIEQLALDFVKFTLAAWLNRWEQELHRCVLTTEERAAGYYFKFNINGLLRGDFVSRMSGYSTMLQNGIANINEVRDLEDWNPFDGGDGHHIQLNMQTLPGGEPLPSQTPQLVRLNPTKE
jgi:HK97 family phage portal protein